MTVIANARINDFGVGVLAKRTMHAPQNNVYGRKTMPLGFHLLNRNNNALPGLQ